MIEIKVKQRIAYPKITKFFTPFFALFFALLFGAGLFKWVGVDPLKAYKIMLSGAFGNFYNFSEVIVRGIPLILSGLSVGLAAKMMLWNIGCEGQIVMGGVGATAIALFASPYLPNYLVIPAMIFSGFIAGALWIFIPAIFKAKWNVSEIISTLMLNYIAIIWMEHLYFGPWRDPEGRGFPGSAIFPDAAWFPRYLGTRIHLGIFIVFIVTILIYILLNFTKLGYEIKVIGESELAARYANIKVTRNIFIVLMISGGIAGLAGVGEVAGVYHRLQQGLSSGYGYAGIIVAWLGRLNPWGILSVGIIFAGFMVGGDALQLNLQLPSSLSLVLEGALLFLVLAGEILPKYKISISWKKLSKS
ncbi:MAG: ABC transporter permease [Deltaproteobacteria bacterium]|nr:ABC transporter permease [Deltaproteobacteria bacterium]RLA90241.1 MAG: ABC transporter permease [Deltaproteobacteria bacterium]